MLFNFNFSFFCYLDVHYRRQGLLVTNVLFPGFCDFKHQSKRHSVFAFAFLRYHLSIHSEYFSTNITHSLPGFPWTVDMSCLLLISNRRTCIGPLSTVIIIEIFIICHIIITFLYVQNKFPLSFLWKGAQCVFIV